MAPPLLIEPGRPQCFRKEIEMRIIKSAAFAALFVIAGTIAALAHAKMTASVPEDGASVASPVSEIAFSFSKPGVVEVSTRVSPTARSPAGTFTRPSDASFTSTPTRSMLPVFFTVRR